MSAEQGRVRFWALLFFLGIILCWSQAAYGVESEKLFTQANNAMAAGELDVAIDLLEQVPPPGAEGDDGSFVRSRMQIARLHFALERFDLARDAALEVLKIYPDNIEAKNFVARVEQESEPAYLSFLNDAVRFLPALIKGCAMTLLLVLCTMIISPVGGLIIALGRISRIRLLSSLCWFFIWLFRGTPLLLQLFFIYYGLPALGITFSPLTAAILGLGLNYSAYLAEIIRGGIQSIEPGQMEAAKALGMSYTQSMRRIIIPQTYKRLMPPVGNEFIALIKDTALVSTIAMVELMRTADQLFNTYFNITVLVLAAMLYLLFTTIFTVAFERFERWVGAYENR
ncbi:MAG: ABC transporter permease subunit [Desulfovibrionales bacterium]